MFYNHSQLIDLVNTRSIMTESSLFLPKAHLQWVLSPF